MAKNRSPCRDRIHVLFAGNLAVGGILFALSDVSPIARLAAPPRIDLVTVDPFFLAGSSFFANCIFDWRPGRQR
jgi:hypothetical protein